MSEENIEENSASTAIKSSKVIIHHDGLRYKLEDLLKGLSEEGLLPKPITEGLTDEEARKIVSEKFGYDIERLQGIPSEMLHFTATTDFEELQETLDAICEGLGIKGTEDLYDGSGSVYSSERKRR